MDTLFLFAVRHPYLVASVIAFFLGVVVFVEVLIFLPRAVTLLITVLRLKKEIRTQLFTSSWPALVDESPGSWERMLFWSGWHGRLPDRKHITITLAIALVAAALLFGFTGTVLVVLVVGFFLAWMYQSSRRAQAMFVQQLPDGLQSMVDTLRAGYTLPQTMLFLSREALPPLQQVFQALHRGETLQLSFDEALKRTATQLGVREWTMVAETLSVQQRLGGNIIPFLEETAKAVRERAAVEQEIKSMTAAGRMSGYLIAGLVPIVLIIFTLLSPSYVGVLFTTVLGRALLFAALVLEVIGFFWIRTIISIDY